MEPQLDENGNPLPVPEKKPPAANKRANKAAAKRAAKAVKEPPPNKIPREDVQIPQIVETFSSPSEDLLHYPSVCCQTCANRNVARAARIGSHDLFMTCVKSKALVSSLIEQIAPESLYSSVEVAIHLNRVDIL